MSQTITTVVKKNNRRGIAVEINDKDVFFINKEFCCFALQGDLVEVEFYPKSKKRYTPKLNGLLKEKASFFWYH